MEEIKRKSIDWGRTGKNLQLLRSDNLNLRRYVCRTLKTRKSDCDGSNCRDCKFDMDNSISQRELAEVFAVSESVIANWEGNRSVPPLEDLIYYSEICGIGLYDIIVFED